MRRIKRYKELFEAQTELSQEQKEWLDKCTRGKWTLNPQTGLVDVGGGFYCTRQNLTDFKGVRFGKVDRDFDCSENELTSLEGAPREVKGTFNCSENDLTSLKGAPRDVKGNFDCSYNELTSLKVEGTPPSVGHYFDCSRNKLTSLEGAPQKINGFFSCSENKLTSLEGAPQEIGGGFYLSYNPVSESVLKSLYKEMQSGMSWPDAVAEKWDSIESEGDKILLAPYHPDPSSEELKGYQALARLKRRSI